MWAFFMPVGGTREYKGHAISREASSHSHHGINFERSTTSVAADVAQRLRRPFCTASTSAEDHEFNSRRWPDFLELATRSPKERTTKVVRRLFCIEYNSANDHEFKSRRRPMLFAALPWAAAPFCAAGRAPRRRTPGVGALIGLARSGALKTQGAALLFANSASIPFFTCPTLLIMVSVCYQCSS